MSSHSVHLIDTNQSECEGVKNSGSKFGNLITTMVLILRCELHALWYEDHWL